MNSTITRICAIAVAFSTSTALAATYNVSTRAQLDAALGAAQDGDVIQLAAGTVFTGVQVYRSNVVGVTIRSADPSNPAILRHSIQLTDANRVTFSDLILENLSGNFINIDDGGTFATPSRNITFRNLTFRQPINAGTNGIKMAGVVGFHIENSTFHGFGDVGAIGIDGVGAMEGTVVHNVFSGTVPGDGYGIQFKGGSENITIRANRFDTYGTRGINNGGSTGDTLFRPGPQGFEARNINVEGNVFINGNSPHAFASSDGGSFRHNLVVNPTQNLNRILTEKFIDGDYYRARNGLVIDNRFTWQNTKYINVGPNTLPDTFTFADNHWYNQTNPANSRPRFDHNLQFIPETGGVYGVPINLDPNKIVPWSFEWGVWLVNASLVADTFSLAAAPEALMLAVPGDGAGLDLGAAYPLVGDWSFQAPGQSVTLDPMTDTILIRQSLVPEPGAAILLLPSLALLLRRRR